mgnify:CR=1 FL=1
MLSLPSSPSPFSQGEKGSRIEVPLLGERDLGFDVSAQPNGEGKLSSYVSSSNPEPRTLNLELQTSNPELP